MEGLRDLVVVSPAVGVPAYPSAFRRSVHVRFASRPLCHATVVRRRHRPCSTNSTVRCMYFCKISQTTDSYIHTTGPRRHSRAPKLASTILSARSMPARSMSTRSMPSARRSTRTRKHGKTLSLVARGWGQRSAVYRNSYSYTRAGAGVPVSRSRHVCGMVTIGNGNLPDTLGTHISPIPNLIH